MATLHFLGATRTVTGSKFVLETDGYRAMVDCGLFQGLKQLRLRNWEPLPLEPGSIGSVILTHAHVDHTGYLPRLVRSGFSGPVYGSPGTVDLARILLPDSGKLQEEDARLANRLGFSKHAPALPLYTEKDARAALKLCRTVKYGERINLTSSLSFELVCSGHILGSTFVSFTINEDSGPVRVLFTGDLGSYDAPIINDPEPVSSTDYLIVESTYGNRLHSNTDPKAELERIINETAARGGRILIPAFAVGRTQELIYYIRELEDENRIPILPVCIDSPMAVNATRLYIDHKEDHDLDMKRLADERRNPLRTRLFGLARSMRESEVLSKTDLSMIVISASGMMTGGRVLNHLKRWGADERNTIIFVGFQAAGTRGRAILDGAKQVKIHGEMIPIRAQVEYIANLSAHADYSEILRWLENFRQPPRKTFIVHGEPEASESLKKKIEEKFGWSVEVPDYLERFQL